MTPVDEIVLANNLTAEEIVKGNYHFTDPEAIQISRKKVLENLHVKFDELEKSITEQKKEINKPWWKFW